MKKIVSLIAAFSLMLSICGCTQADSPIKAENITASSTCDKDTVEACSIYSVAKEKVNGFAERAMASYKGVGEKAERQPYTTGDKATDDMLKKIVDEQVTDNMSFEDSLLALYRYVRDNYRYRKGNYYDVGDTSFCMDETRKILETGCGNCYAFAALLYNLYRMVGLDCTLYSGTIGKGHSPHGWVEADIDGVTYIFDVETEYAYLYRPSNTGSDTNERVWKNMFMRTYEQMKGWNYKR